MIRLGRRPKLLRTWGNQPSVRPDDETIASQHLIQMSDLVQCSSAACRPELLAFILE